MCIRDRFIDAIKELSVLELNDLVKACEEEFGVSAAAGVDVYKRQDLNCLRIETRLSLMLMR